MSIAGSPPGDALSSPAPPIGTSACRYLEARVELFQKVTIRLGTPRVATKICHTNKG